jgi:hypothetical protein
LRADENGDGTETKMDMEVDGVLDADDSNDNDNDNDNDTDETALVACGVAEWEPVWLGRADYLDNGVERDWSVSRLRI